MITTLLSLYASGTLMLSDLPSAVPHTMPWNNTFVETTAIPQKKATAIGPVIKAKSAIAVDLENGLILYEKNTHETLPIASLTKLMTATLILEENNLKDEVTVSKKASMTEGSKIWLAPGEKITVENLLYAVFINSANDAAMVLAEYNSGNIQKFVEKMNQKSKDLGLIATRFINPTGLDQGGKNNDNYSTAYDLTLLAHYSYGKSFVRRATIKKEMEITSIDQKLKHKLKNTNELLGSYLKVLGLKTGTTDEAGECLIAIIENDQGHDILTVVLNSPSRYNETKLLADWVFRSYNWN